ncbi:hypothetical protein SCLCIDRAFT_1224168 [Scleroderma citrinum Foug A]|uniref:Uncharacterized protein n=1 Tax=Scleroderma citrinum Foug A TaxID=1036808 RepID=A0A0C3CT63_9AGAM|nr:hypothetical protein SCLCIDRAFT_1224168 [Scleroderma citrinum Foug A]
MQVCLGVIHDDIIGLWNFRDEGKLLRSKEFREFMLNLVNLLDRLMDCPPSPQQSETMSSMQKEITACTVGLQRLPANARCAAEVHSIHCRPNQRVGYIVHLDGQQK